MIKNTFLYFAEEDEAAPTKRSSSTPPSSRLSCCSTECSSAGGSPRSSLCSPAAAGTPRSSLCAASPADCTTVDAAAVVADHQELSPVLRAMLERAEPGATVMVRNVPPNCTQRQLLRDFKQLGFGRLIDLFYLPMEFQSMQNLGYSFVNLVSEDAAVAFSQAVQGHRLAAFPHSKALVVGRGRLQGFEENFKTFRNSRVMGRSVPPEFQPIIMNPLTGVEVPFPQPTRKLKKTKKVNTQVRTLQKRLYEAAKTITDDRSARKAASYLVKTMDHRKPSTEEFVASAEGNPQLLAGVIASVQE
mmetsp:Transcript_31408/g.71760  ORF Transcript_31408/g.71760 Transcript_31408/m.71760 type:complete len:302 (+) Transcript_31408:44-949(+)